MFVLFCIFIFCIFTFCFPGMPHQRPQLEVTLDFYKTLSVNQINPTKSYKIVDLDIIHCRKLYFFLSKHFRNMNSLCLTEQTSLIRHEELAYLQPLTLTWRVNHTIPYLIGGTTFLAGSYQYLPSVSNYELGGWLFTIGSVGFLYADLNEWWKNNRVGCAFDDDYRDDFEKQLGNRFDPSSSFCGKFQRAENGLNFALSAVGSLLYLIGSILFIPELNATVMGTIIFIPGSFIIFLSQMIKLYRAGCVYSTGTRRVEKFQHRTFQLRHLTEDLPAVGVDLAAGLGGFAYMIGSYLFLPSVAVTDVEITRAAIWFLLGGALFLASGLCLTYRYFCTQNYPH